MMSIPGLTCVWCGGDGAEHWLCRQCELTPWPQGARFVLHKLWRETENDNVPGNISGGYRLRVLDRAYCHRVVHINYPPDMPRSTRARKQRARCRDLNRWHLQSLG